MGTVNGALVEVISTEQCAAIEKLQRRVPILAVSSNDLALSIGSLLPSLSSRCAASFTSTGRPGDDENLRFRMAPAQDVDEYRERSSQMPRIRAVGIVVQNEQGAIVDECDGFGDLRLPFAVAGESKVDTRDLQAP